jgi:hypothetical protein
MKQYLLPKTSSISSDSSRSCANYLLNHHTITGIYRHWGENQGYNRVPRVFIACLSLFVSMSITWAVLWRVISPPAFFLDEAALQANEAILHRKPLDSPTATPSLTVTFGVIAYTSLLLLVVLSFLKMVLRLTYLNNSKRDASDLKSVVVINQFLHTIKTIKYALLSYFTILCFFTTFLIFIGLHNDITSSGTSSSNETTPSSVDGFGPDHDSHGTKDVTADDGGSTVEVSVVYILQSSMSSWVLYLGVAEPLFLLLSYCLFKPFPFLRERVDDLKQPQSSRGLWI